MIEPPLPPFVSRVLDRLVDAEAREPNSHFQDDYRICRIAVANAARGDPLPFLAATYVVIGLHPDKVWPAVVARRKAMLGPMYADFFPEALPPKKPVQSVGVVCEISRDAA